MPGDPSDETPERRNQLITTSLMWAVHFVGGRYAEAAVLAGQLAAVDAPIWRFQGLVCQAYTEYFRGNATHASECLDAAAAIYPDYLDPDLNSLPTHPPTAFHVIGSLICWYLGRPADSDRHARRAREVASALPADGAPDLAPPFRGVFRDFNLAGVHAFEATRLVLQEDFRGAREQARLERQVVAQHSARAGMQTVFASYDGLANLYDCFAAANDEPGRDANADAFEAHVTLRLEQGASGASLHHCMLAQLRLGEGDPARALAAIEQGLAGVAAMGEHFFESELIALRGRVRRAAGQPAGRLDLEEALRQAKERSSPPLQLRAARAWALADPAEGRGILEAALDACGERVSPFEREAALALLRRA